MRKSYVLELEESEYHDLLAVLAYTSRQETYPEDYPQHEILKTKAGQFWAHLKDK